MGLYFLASYALCFALTQDKVKFLTDPLRRVAILDSLLNCSFCTGFYTGLVLGSVRAYFETDHPVSVESAVLVVVFALASAAFCYVLDTAVAALSQEV
jgi:hypothetical protein